MGLDLYMRLIDADKLLKVLDTNSIYRKTTYSDGRNIGEIIEDMPTVDTERHGHLIKKKLGYSDVFERELFAYYCSECGRRFTMIDFKKGLPYCNCGAKMDEVVEND